MFKVQPADHQRTKTAKIIENKRKRHIEVMQEKLGTALGNSGELHSCTAEIDPSCPEDIVESALTSLRNAGYKAETEHAPHGVDVIRISWNK